MAINVTATGTANGSTNSSVPTCQITKTTGGDFIVLLLSVDGTGTITSISDNSSGGGLDWFEAYDSAQGTAPGAAIYYAYSDQVAETITITASTSVDIWIMQATELSGVAPSAPIGAANVATGTGTTFTRTITTTAANSIAFGVCSVSSADTPTIDSPATQIYTLEVGTSNKHNACGGREAVASAGSYTMDGAIGKSSDWRFVLAEIKQDTSPATARVTALDGTLTYSETLARVTALDGTLTYSETTARVTALDATVTYSETTGRVTALDALVTYSELSSSAALAFDGDDSKQWDTPDPGSNSHYDQLEVIASASDASAVTTTTADDIDQYTVAATPADVGTVKAVEAQLRGYIDDGSSSAAIEVTLWHTGTTQVGSAQYLTGTSFGGYNTTYATASPLIWSGLSLTKTQADSLEVRVKAITAVP